MFYCGSVELGRFIPVFFIKPDKSHFTDVTYFVFSRILKYNTLKISDMKTEIEKYEPCRNALRWFNAQESDVQAWQNCHRGDWMLWIAYELGVDNRKIILAAGTIANTVRHLMEDEGVKAVGAAMAYGRGEIEIEELKEAAEAAEAAEATEAAEAAVYAAIYAAIYATDATEAANAAAAAAKASESREAREASLLNSAKICREILTEDVLKY